MYLFRGGAPVKEFANFKPPISWGVRMSGNKFFQNTLPRGVSDARRGKFRAELKLPIILLGRHHQPRNMDKAMAAGSTSWRWARAAGRTGPAQPHPGGLRGAVHLRSLQPVHADHLQPHALCGDGALDR